MFLSGQVAQVVLGSNLLYRSALHVFHMSTLEVILFLDCLRDCVRGYILLLIESIYDISTIFAVATYLSHQHGTSAGIGAVSNGDDSAESDDDNSAGSFELLPTFQPTSG